VQNIFFPEFQTHATGIHTNGCSGIFARVAVTENEQGIDFSPSRVTVDLLKYRMQPDVFVGVDYAEAGAVRHSTLQATVVQSNVTCHSMFSWRNVGGALTAKWACYIPTGKSACQANSGCGPVTVPRVVR